MDLYQNLLKKVLPMNNIFSKSNLLKFLYFITPPIVLYFFRKVSLTRKKKFSDDSYV